jgi:hypothetical protein
MRSMQTLDVYYDIGSVQLLMRTVYKVFLHSDAQYLLRM